MKYTRIFVVLLSLMFASASQAQMSIGGLIGSDHKRLEIAPSVSFGMAVYTQRPPARGFDGSGLVGLFSSSLGQYPAVTAGLWVKAQVDPFGIETLIGISRAKVFNPSIKKDGDWEPITREEDGRYTDIRQLNEVGVVPFVYRLEHRDGRDRYQVLFITFGWTRGGNLPAKLEIMVRPQANQTDDILSYLSGFLPAYGPLHAKPESQNVTIPGQTATQTISGSPVGDKSEIFPVIAPPSSNRTEKAEIPPFGVEILALQYDKERGYEDSLDKAVLIKEPPTITNRTTHTTLDLGDNSGTAVLFESEEPFSGEITAKSGKVVELEVSFKDGKYKAVFAGSTKQYHEYEIVITLEQNGLKRILKFATGETS